MNTTHSDRRQGPQRQVIQLACLVLAWIACAPATASAQDGCQLIRAETVYTVSGEVISPGAVVVHNGKIVAVGPAADVTAPAGLAVKEIEVSALMPGLINVASSAGLAGGDDEVSREVTPDFDTYSALDWNARAFKEALHSGVTTLQVLPDTDSVFCGHAVVLKTSPADMRDALDRRRAVVMAMSSDPTSRNRSRSRPDSIYVRQPTNRMGVVWIIRNALHQAGQGAAARGLDPNTQEILSDITAGKRPVLAVSRTDIDIRSAIALGKEFGFQPAIYGGDEVYRLLDEAKQANLRIAFSGLTSSSSNRGLRGNEGTDLRWNVPGKLQEAGIEFCLAGDDLLQQARFATRFGLDAPTALAAVTHRAAKMIGMEQRTGSIAVGKDADLVALSGDPLQPTSAVVWTMVNGTLFIN